MQMQPVAWLTQTVLPLWIKNGVVPQTGGFVEALSAEGQPLDLPMRAMVQARQIYSLRIALGHQWLDQEQATLLIVRATENFMMQYSHPSGGFIYSVKKDGRPFNENLELYTQAFALFGLANAYAVTRKSQIKDRAIRLYDYLQSERRLKQGGFVEIIDGKVMYEANPHMHLFEAAIAWLEIDSDSRWKSLAGDLLELCLKKFIDRKTGCLAEHFDSEWEPIGENTGFVFEPGHHYEWAWLMGRYSRLTNTNLINVQNQLFEVAENYGTKNGIVYDEVWSNFIPKTKTSRFWPHCERIKCASLLGKGLVADQALETLFKYFQTPTPGLWNDRMSEQGTFKIEPAKGSSLYHIIGAISEYQQLKKQ